MLLLQELKALETLRAGSGGCGEAASCLEESNRGGGGRHQPGFSVAALNQHGKYKNHYTRKNNYGGFPDADDTSGEEKADLCVSCSWE